MHKQKWLLIVLFFLSAVIANAQDFGDDLAYELYVKSGLEKQMLQTPLMIQAGFDQAVINDINLQRLPHNTLSEMRSLVKESFAAESLKKTILEEINAKMQQHDIKRVIEWLDSPLGKKCTQLEEAATTPETMTQMQAFAGQIQQSPPSSDRLVLMRRLDSAVKATETSVAVAMKTEFAVATAIVSSLPLENQPSSSEIMGGIEQRRPQLEAAMKSYILVSLLYTYNTLTDSEVKQYIDFANSSIGAKYHKATISGVESAIIDCSIKWGSSIAELLKNLDKESAA